MLRLTFVVLAAVSATACSNRSDRAHIRGPGGDSAVITALPDSIRIHRERRVGLGPDSIPLTFVLTANGRAPDSLRIHLTVSLADTVLYRHSWTSQAYLECECDSADAPAFEKAMMGKIVGLVESVLDSGFVAPAVGGRFWEPENYLNAVVSEIAPQLLPNTATSADSVSVSRKAFRLESDPHVDHARLIRGEQLGNTVFQYQFGIKPYCIIGWSPSERRILRILCGP